MNKTTTISLGKVFFHIDEEAFQMLKEYLRKITLYLNSEESREEIIADIEARIAELFSTNLKSDREVISVKDVEEVIAIMGQPEDYQVEGEEEPDTKTKASTSSKRFFRDPDNYYLGGVCGGLAHYLSMETVWVRLIWVLLGIFTQGVFVLLYIILWIITPLARTTADKLAMKGQPINLDNIEKKVKEDFKFAKEKVGEFAKEHEPTTRKVVQETGNVLKQIVLVVLKIIGVILIVVSILSIVGIVIFFLSFGSLSSFDVFDSFSSDMFPFDAPKILQLILYCVVSLIPMIILFQLGQFLINPSKHKFSRKLLISNVVLFIMAIASLGFLGIRLGMKDTHKGEVVFAETIVVHQADTLQIAPTYNYKYFDGSESYNHQKTKLVDDNGQLVFASKHIQFALKPSNTNDTKVIWSKIAKAYTAEQATEIAKEIEYFPEFEDTSIKLPTYFTFPQEFSRNKASIEVRIYLSEGVHFKVTESLYEVLDYPSRKRLKGFKNQFVRLENTVFICTSCPKEIENLFDENANEIQSINQ